MSMSKYDILQNLISLYNSNRLDNNFYTLLSSLISICIKSKYYSLSYENKSELTNDILIVLYTKISEGKITSVNNIDKYIDKILPIYYSKVRNRYSKIINTSYDRSSTTSIPHHTTIHNNIQFNYKFVVSIYEKYTCYKSGTTLHTYTKISYLLSVYNILVNNDDSIILYKLDRSMYSYINYLVSVLFKLYNDNK